MSKVRSFLSNYSLSIILFILFFGSLVLQTYTGWIEFRGEEYAHGQIPEIFGQTGYIWSLSRAIFENWQSEFLQLFSFVLLTVYFKHKNSPQSRDGDDRRDAELQEMKNMIKHTYISLEDLKSSLKSLQRATTWEEWLRKKRALELTTAGTFNPSMTMGGLQLSGNLTTDEIKKIFAGLPKVKYDEYVMEDAEATNNSSEQFAPERLEEIAQSAVSTFIDRSRNREDAQRIAKISGLLGE